MSLENANNKDGMAVVRVVLNSYDGDIFTILKADNNS